MGESEIGPSFAQENAESEAVEALQAEIRARRGDPTVLVVIRSSRSNLLVEPRRALDALVVQLGLTALGEQWREIDPEIATSLGAAVLSQSFGVWPRGAVV